MPYVLSEEDLARIKSECKARIRQTEQVDRPALRPRRLLIAVSAAAVIVLGICIFNPIQRQTPYEKYISQVNEAPKEYIEDMCADMIYYDDEVNTKYL